jgi:hypothetical protein
MWYGFADVKAQARKDSACQVDFLGSVTRGAAPSQGNGRRLSDGGTGDLLARQVSWLECRISWRRRKNAAVGKSGRQSSN